jgi:hypothetical protein
MRSRVTSTLCVLVLWPAGCGDTSSADESDTNSADCGQVFDFAKQDEELSKLRVEQLMAESSKDDPEAIECRDYCEATFPLLDTITSLSDCMVDFESGFLAGVEAEENDETGPQELFNDSDTVAKVSCSGLYRVSCLF